MNKIINDIGNYYEVKEDVAYITVLKKDGTELITKIDLENLEKIKNINLVYLKDVSDELGLQNGIKIIIIT